MGATSFYHGDVTPERVFQRQSQKGHILSGLVDALGLREGDSVLDVGSGPGFASLLMAEKVGPKGRVWALDASSEALQYLSARCEERSIDWVHSLVADATEFRLPAGEVRHFLVTDMLHDADDPQAILDCLARELPQGAVGVIGEYRPVEVRQSGPDPAIRIPEERMRGWLTECGFAIRREWYPPDDHYAFLVER